MNNQWKRKNRVRVVVNAAKMAHVHAQKMHVRVIVIAVKIVRVVVNAAKNRYMPCILPFYHFF
jgi:hypothetical protein